MDTVEELGGTYFFDGMINLDKIELLYWIFIDEADKQLGGVKDILALAAMIGGLPIIPVKGKIDAVKPHRAPAQFLKHREHSSNIGSKKGKNAHLEQHDPG